MRQREYAGPADLILMASLVQMTVAEVRRFMDDASIDPRRDFGLWESAAGRLMASALVTVRTGWFVFALAQDVTIDEGRQVLNWGLTRLEDQAHLEQSMIPVTTQCADTDTLKRNLLTQAGFWPVTPTQFSMVRHLGQSVADINLPVFYHLRSLDPASDFHAYQDLARATFGYSLDDVRWESMTRPCNVNLVINMADVDNYGEEKMIAACRGIIRDEESEPVARKGLIADLGTRPEFRRQGLARAVLQACVSQLCEHGVTEINLDTDNPGAMALYEASGFKTAYQWRIYARDIQA